ncbi:biopolymer transporter ExbD [Pseudoalteromonas piscicida]|uniref:ExbD/TolR family protein n=1 Tax=Pseudoalteromonas piscicida TaxID=43662 RepID=UPI0030A8AB58
MAFSNQHDDIDDGQISDINTTPLVDVMLVLLVIFIITLPVINQTVEVDLPSEQASQNEPEATALYLTVDKQGQLFLDNQALDEKAFKAALTKHDTKETVYLRGDKQVAYEHVIKAMSQLQQAGFYNLAFVTEPTP